MMSTLWSHLLFSTTHAWDDQKSVWQYFCCKSIHLTCNFIWNMDINSYVDTFSLWSQSTNIFSSCEIQHCALILHAAHVGCGRFYGHYDKFHGSIFSPTLRFERNYWVATAVQITSIACLLFWRYSLLCLSINPHHESWELKEIFRLLNWFEMNINDHVWILFVSAIRSRKEEISPPRYYEQIANQYYASNFIFIEFFPRDLILDRSLMGQLNLSKADHLITWSYTETAKYPRNYAKWEVFRSSERTFIETLSFSLHCFQLPCHLFLVRCKINTLLRP